MMVAGESGLCRWMCGSGTIAPGDVDGFVAHIRATRPRRGLVMIDFVHSISTPSAADRRLIAEAVREVLSSSPDIAGHALVSNSSVARGVMTAINWMAKTPFPESTFATPALGLAWAAQLSPTIDPGAILADLHEQVPGFASLRW